MGGFGQVESALEFGDWPAFDEDIESPAAEGPCSPEVGEKILGDDEVSALGVKHRGVASGEGGIAFDEGLLAGGPLAWKVALAKGSKKGGESGGLNEGVERWRPAVVWSAPAGGVEGKEPAVAGPGLFARPAVELGPESIEKEGGMTESGGVIVGGDGMAKAGDHSAGETIARGGGSRWGGDGIGRMGKGSLVRGADAHDDFGGGEFDFDPPVMGATEAKIDIVPEDSGIEILLGIGSGNHPRMCMAFNHFEASCECGLVDESTDLAEAAADYWHEAALAELAAVGESAAFAGSPKLAPKAPKFARGDFSTIEEAGGLAEIFYLTRGEGKFCR